MPADTMTRALCDLARDADAPMTDAVRRMVLDFRVWQVCSAREWNMQVKEVADALGCHHAVVTAVLKRRGWLSRIRASRRASLANFAFENAMIHIVTGQTRRELAGAED